jgi:hypothetical protein
LLARSRTGGERRDAAVNGHDEPAREWMVVWDGWTDGRTGSSVDMCGLVGLVMFWVPSVGLRFLGRRGPKDVYRRLLTFKQSPLQNRMGPHHPRLLYRTGAPCTSPSSPSAVAHRLDAQRQSFPTLCCAALLFTPCLSTEQPNQKRRDLVRSQGDVLRAPRLPCRTFPNGTRGTPRAHRPRALRPDQTYRPRLGTRGTSAAPLSSSGGPLGFRVTVERTSASSGTGTSLAHTCAPHLGIRRIRLRHCRTRAASTEVSNKGTCPGGFPSRRVCRGDERR